MKKRFLQMKTVMRAVMLILMMGVVGVTEGQESDITFDDAKVKALCVDKWDTNKDDKLSYDEAAAVTDLGEVFKDNTDITSFNELQYFTGLKAIGNNAFEYCTSLSSITIPNTVISIGEYAFHKCTRLISVEIPNSVTSIGGGAFLVCTGLKSVEIPNSVTGIGTYAFYSCSSVKSLTIPNSVTSIGGGAFAECSGLIEITSFANSVPPIGYETFHEVNKSIPVYVPCSLIRDYQTASGWNEFTNYQPMPNATITGYGESTDHWVFIASPLAKDVPPTDVNGLVADPEENYDLYRFNQSGEKGEWQNYKNKDHTEGFVLENGKGYLYANKNNVNLTFVGTMNTTNSQEVELYYDGTANLPGWNLIGNPFTEAAYIVAP